MALGVLVTTVVVIIFPSREAEAVITLLPYTLALSVTLAAGVLWALRHRRADEPGVAGQRLQSVAAIVLNSLSFAILLFALQRPKHAIIGLLLEAGFLLFCYW